MDKEILTQTIDYLLVIPAFFLILLLIRSVLTNLWSLKWKFRKFGRKHWLQVLKDMKTPLFGLLVIVSAFALTNTLLGGVTIEESKWLEIEATQNPETITEGLLYLGNTGIVGVSLFMFAGFFYILSGFRDWLKWIARFFMLAAPGYILMQIFHYAVLAA